jgi:hypothetical protein
MIFYIGWIFGSQIALDSSIRLRDRSKKQAAKSARRESASKSIAIHRSGWRDIARCINEAWKVDARLSLAQAAGSKAKLAPLRTT